jgi:hypothetical protein
MRSRNWLVVILGMLPIGGLLLGVTLYHFIGEDKSLEGCKYVFVLGGEKSHVDQEGDYLILVNPKQFECRDDWNHDDKYGLTVPAVKGQFL